MSRDFLLMLLLIFFTLIAIGGMSIVRTRYFEDVPLEYNKDIHTPLDPKLDIELLERLEI